MERDRVEDFTHRLFDYIILFLLDDQEYDKNKNDKENNPIDEVTTKISISLNHNHNNIHNHPLHSDNDNKDNENK